MAKKAKKAATTIVNAKSNAKKNKIFKANARFDC
jgi:hypothetical protein